MEPLQSERATSDATETPRSVFTTDAIFDTLSSRRRRYVLHALKRAGGPMTIRNLSEQLAAWENDVPIAEVRPQQRKRLYTALHQTHLPKMAELGVVRYDRNRGVVALDGRVEQFDVYFDTVGSRFGGWSLVYLALGAILTPIAAMNAFGVGPAALIDGPMLALVTAVLFSGVAVVHAVSDRTRTTRVVDGPPEAISDIEDGETGRPR